MKFLYSQWNENSATDEQRLEQLVKLFNYLALQSSGNLEDVFDWLRQLGEEYGIFNETMSLEDLIEKLKELGLIEEIEGTFQLTPKGTQNIRTDALKEIFSSLKKSDFGSHESPHTGSGVERLSETKKWNFGDLPTNIDLTSTVTNALKRDGIDSFNLQEDDLEVFETENLSSCATVMMIDISHSMILYGEDRITPAKKVALALAELIQTKFPKDFLACITFGDDAELISLAEIPFLHVGPFHTNTRAGLQMARNLLRKNGNANKQIFMITDGKPSAMFDDSGRLYKNPIGLDPKIVNKTIDEAVQCRREKITISTFMIAQDPYLINFVEELTKANKGRAYYSSLGNLGQYIFVDYIKNRRKKL
ncbi:MAG: VWA domain-containing protein [Bacteroidetes bacterium]|nr:VWA domain-containing protein [Bacteroidota bacterium]